MYFSLLYICKLFVCIFSKIKIVSDYTDCTIRLVLFVSVFHKLSGKYRSCLDIQVNLSIRLLHSVTRLLWLLYANSDALSVAMGTHLTPRPLEAFPLLLPGATLARFCFHPRGHSFSFFLASPFLNTERPQGRFSLHSLPG